MILVGNQRGNAKDLAIHLLKQENEQVEVHEIRGFCSDNLMGALNESYAMSRATKCKQHLFSLSLNPPKEANVSNEQFEAAISRVEEKLGLTGQPRAIVFHEKEGRRHCHTVWSRFNAEELKAVQLSYSKQKMQEVARNLYLEHGWKMPRGLANKEHADPRNYTLAEWQQAKRLGKEARDVKADLQDAWAISDNKATFTHALEERGYKLARGDRRGFVAVDHHGEPYSLSKWAKVKPKQLIERLGEPDSFPSFEETRALYAKEMLDKMQSFQQEIELEKREKERLAEAEQQRLLAEQAVKKQTMAQALKLRQLEEERLRLKRIRYGLLGLLDRITGQRKRILQQNELEKQQTLQRDKREQQSLEQMQEERKRHFIEKRKEQQQPLDQQKQVGFSSNLFYTRPCWAYSCFLARGRVSAFFFFFLSFRLFGNVSVCQGSVTFSRNYLFLFIFTVERRKKRKFLILSLLSIFFVARVFNRLIATTGSKE